VRVVAANGATIEVAPAPLFTTQPGGGGSTPSPPPTPTPSPGAGSGGSGGGGFLAPIEPGSGTQPTPEPITPPTGSGSVGPGGASGGGGGSSGGGGGASGLTEATEDTPIDLDLSSDEYDFGTLIDATKKPQGVGALWDAMWMYVWTQPPATHTKIQSYNDGTQDLFKTSPQIG